MPKLGIRFAFKAWPATVLTPCVCDVLVVVTVTTADSPAATPVTVTTPVPFIEALPEVAVALQE